MGTVAEMINGISLSYNASEAARINNMDLLWCVDVSSGGIDVCADLLTSRSSEAV